MVVDEGDGARRAQLLIGIRDEDDVAGERNAAALERDHRHEMCDALALHVECASTIQESILDHATVRRNRPVALDGRRYVDVMNQRECFLAAGSLESRVEVEPAGAQQAGGGGEQL